MQEKSNWEPPVQPSVTLESHLEEVKTELAEVKISKPKNNLPKNERQAHQELQKKNNINVKKADKGTTTVIVNTQDKKREVRVRLAGSPSFEDRVTLLPGTTFLNINTFARSAGTTPQKLKSVFYL